MLDFALDAAGGSGVDGELRSGEELPPGGADSERSGELAGL